jgi:hypothetical protein
MTGDQRFEGSAQAGFRPLLGFLLPALVGALSTGTFGATESSVP